MTATPPAPGEAPDPFSEAVKVRRGIDAPLRALILDAFGLDVADPAPVHGGEEAATWKVTAADAHWIVRISPTWRSVDELEWVYGVVDHVAGLVPEVPRPRPTRHGAWTVLVEGHPVTVHPFVPGRRLDRRDPVERDAVAGLLARVHRALSTWPGRRERPGRRPLPAAPDAPDLDDPELDRWQGDLPRLGLPRDLIHGDVYPRNVLWHEGRIAALVDWDELASGWREQEVAWTIWEFCHNEPGTDIDRPATAAFLAAYEEAGGAVASGFAGRAGSFIRIRLRDECRAALAAQAEGRPFDAAYLAAELAAFANLRGVVLA